ncbi:MAG: DUF1028 domain-containing protein [Alphaproteobacteria bacterium]|nr:DUF1028 domain-containing protein [Alphaproteobacteria bacterium]
MKGKAVRELAIEFNTFTIVGRCARTGALGVATSTGEMAVGSRVPFVKTGVGAVATQALTDPRHGPKGLALLEEGLPPADVVEKLAASDPHIESRQIAVVDAQGRVAARTGSDNRDWNGHHEGDGFVAMGNRLTGGAVVDAMAAAFRDSAGEALEERLVRAIEAGRDAGGQHGGQRSAAIKVCDELDYPIVDLRADDYDEPIAELRRLFDTYAPRIPYYRVRAADPTIGPFYLWKEAQGL